MKFIVLATLFLSSADAFTPAAQVTRSCYSANAESASGSALHLLPNQGCQLAAASAAALANEAKQARVMNAPTGHAAPVNAARELVSRIFNLPSEILKVPDNAVHTDAQDDVAFYPIVGFTYVKHEDKTMVISPVNAKGAINIQNRKKTQEEEVHGWFSSSCQLGSPHADNYASYSGIPESPGKFMGSEQVKDIHPSEM
jgi:hypothetical protein|eukprot:scaffold10238_cov276-Chaetoceros_neogracile.AAC.19